MATPIVQTATFSVPPKRVYEALLDAEQHAAFTGAPASLQRAAGTRFTTHAGQIEGVQLELVDDTRIVQAWRPAGWPPGLYSVVRYELEATEGGTQLTLTHSGVPDEAEPMVRQGWEQRYWAAMQAYFA